MSCATVAVRPTATAAASAWLRALMTGPQRGVRVLGAGRVSSYLQVDDGDVVALEAAGGARLPNAIAAGGAPLRAGSYGAIGAGVLRVDDTQVRVRRWWDPRPRPAVTTPQGLRRVSAGLPRAAVADGYGLAAPVRRLAAALVAGDLDALDPAVDDLIGRGPGSTPAGDDVVAGVLATLRVLGPAVDDGPVLADRVALAARRNATSTTRLSATLLRCAGDGAVVAAAGRVLCALAGHGPLDPAVAGLARIGHTSGRDLLAGIAIGVDALIGGRRGR